MSAAALAADLWRGALDLVLAPVCVGCGATIPAAADERIVCRACWLRCREVPAPRCSRCWAPVPPAEADLPKCRICADWPAALRVARAAFAMGPAARELVHALKYRGWEAAAVPMAARIAALPAPRDIADEARLVIPVPTSATRLRERGYNQAALLGREVARRTSRTFAADLLVRVSQSSTQTSLHPSERRANVARAFAAVPGDDRLDGAHVVLVDDVWTTGATALACVDALVHAGARVVSVFTFARVFPEFDE